MKETRKETRKEKKKKERKEGRKVGRKGGKEGQNLGEREILLEESRWSPFMPTTILTSFLCFR